MKKIILMTDTELYTNFYDKVLNGTLGLIERRLAEDITQETFIRAFDAIKRGLFDGKHPRTWLDRVAKNLLIDYYRANARTVNAYVDERGTYLDIHDPIDDEQEHSKHMAEMSEEIEHILTKINKEQADVFKRFYSDGLRVKDIASERGDTIGSVLGRLYNARIAIRKKLRT